MATDSINGLDQEAIEEELHLLIRAHANTGEIPDGQNGAVSDAIYEDLEGYIPTLAWGLTQVQTIQEAEAKTAEYLEDVVFGAATSVDSGYDDEKLYRYIDVFSGEIGGILLELGFNVDNVES